MKEWSNAWKASTKANKQRKYRSNAPLSVKKKLVSAHLSKELRQKYNKRNISIVKGDKVKIVVGQFKGHSGKVDKVYLKKGKIIVSGVEIQKKDGSKTQFLIQPSNVIIQELKLDDKKRTQILERKKQK